MVDKAQQPLLRWLSVPHRIALMYAAMFFVTGVSTPFLPVWFASRGFSAVEIGLLAILPQIVRSMFAPAVGFEADRRLSHRALTIGLSGLGLIGWLWLWWNSGFGAALAAMVLIALSNTLLPLVESIAMSGVRSAGHNYGRMRLWGSAGYVAANLLSGWLDDRSGPAWLIALMAAGAAATFAASLLLPQPADLATDRGPASRLTWASALAVLRVPMMPVFLVASGCLQGAHGMYYTYGTLNWQAQQIDPVWFGMLWAVGLITEISLFWWSSTVIARLGAAGLMAAGAVLSVFRWTLMSFDPPLGVLMPLQLLHGLTFGASHLGAVHVLSHIAPRDRTATAQALYSLASTAGIVIATALAARLYPAVGGTAYLAMAIMAAIGLMAAILIQRTTSRMQ